MRPGAKYRKYDTCFFERYAILSLQRLLGHKFDGLVNHDRPDLQSEDGHTLGIEVTRAMEGGRAAALQMLKEIAGVVPDSGIDPVSASTIIRNGYGYGIHEGKYVGGLELDYWRTARPMKEIIRNKVGKVSSGFYGDFDEFGLFIFSKEKITEESAQMTVRFILDLQKDNEIKYRRLFLSSGNMFYACNLDDDISFVHRILALEVSQEERKALYLGSLRL